MIKLFHHLLKNYFVLLLALLTAVPVFAGSTSRDFTVGSHPSCDFQTINQAISSGFPCNDPNGCVAGDPRLLLSQNYSAHELIFINQSLDIYGGYDNSCDGTPSENLSVIDSPGTNTSGKVMYIYPPNDAIIDVILKNVAILAVHGNNNNQGGAIVMDPGFDEPGVINLTIWNSSVSGGLSERGGGIYMSGNHRLTLLDATILGNRALAGSSFLGNGGGIFCEDGGYINFISGSVKFNDADSFGGGIYLDSCYLTGQGINTVRTIENNKVLRSLSDIAGGKGGGLFAKGGTVRIELGGLLSRTQIKNNKVTKWFNEEFRTDSTALGGGMHLETGAQAVLINTEFIGNEAPDGGGVSMQSGSSLVMDRSSGPCLTGSEEGCSVFIDNQATGDIDWAGSGSAIYAFNGVNDATIQLDIKRSVFTGNVGYEHNGDGGWGSMLFTQYTDANIVGNLIHSNSLEDDTSVILNDRYGDYFKFINGNTNFIQNTIVYNENSGAVLFSSGAVINAIANIIYDPAQEYGLIDDDDSDQIFYYACNISSEGWFNNIIQDGGGNALVESEPDFLDSSVANFRLQSSSIATNVCDDQGGLLNLGFDIAGRARPQTGGQTPVLGSNDAGAFEYQINSATEVDLVMVANLESATGGLGAKYRVTATNIGLKPMIHSDLKFKFPVQGDYDFVGTNWDCVTIANSNPETVECSSSHNSLIDVATSSLPLIIEVSPDSFSQCELDVTAISSATQVDTDLSNNNVRVDPVDCLVQDLIFKDDFESFN